MSRGFLQAHRRRTPALERELAWMRALRRSLRLLLPLALLAACAAAVVVAVRADREVRELRSEVASMTVDVGRLQQRGEHSAAELSILDRRLQVVSHPLHAALMWPVDGAVTSPFEERRCCSVHPGIDIDAPEGAGARAAGAGVVVAAGWESGYGNRVVIDHGRGLTTLYAHLGRVAVAEQEAVTAASVVGTVGCTGSCYGVHLHFEVRLRGAKTDPALWLPEQRRGVASLRWAG